MVGKSFVRRSTSGDIGQSERFIDHGEAANGGVMGKNDAEVANEKGGRCMRA